MFPFPDIDVRREDFLRDGYLVLPAFVPQNVCRALIDRADALVAGFDPDAHRSIFTTREQARASDDYFLESGEDVRFFFEEEAFDTGGRLKQPKERSINKIGHALHDRDPVFAAFSRAPALAAVAAALGMRAPLLLQSMYIFKQPHIGGEVTCHQDATFLYTDPMTVIGLWFALEDATLENGCLWAKPGGHEQGVKRRFVRAPGGGTEFITLDPTPLDESGLPLPADGPRASRAREGLVPLPVPAGSLIVLDGCLPHRSDANRSPRSRHAYTLHLVEADAHYPADNWLQRRAMPPRGF